MGSQEKGTKKRKRTKNTSADQYEMYIHLLQNDAVFRTGIVNPTLEDNYLNKKWQELTELLNSSDEGPHMSAEEWKKRFSDGKYGVRAKARTIIEHQNKTGSGPQTELKLTPMENKVLSLWGKVVVTETPLVDSYDGLPSIINHELPATFEANDNIVVECTPEVQDEIMCSSHQLLEEIDVIHAIEVEPSSLKSAKTNSNKTVPNTSFISKPTIRTRQRPKPLSALAEKLINISTNSDRNQETMNNLLNNFGKDYFNYKKEELKLQQRKISFEIAKYKFENPNFNFEDDQM